VRFRAPLHRRAPGSITSSLDVSGRYGLNGYTNLYIGRREPCKALFGNNNKPSNAFRTAGKQRQP
jgi:hypothetical protein